MSSGFEQLGERVVYDGAVISVAVGTFSAPDGSTFDRDIVRHPGAVSVVPVDGDEVVLVRQYRATVGRELLEIPAGKRDIAHEPPETAARRELVEEVGYEATTLVPLAEYFNSVGFSDEYSHVYLATDLVPASARPDGIEDQHMVVERLALDEIDAAIADRRIVDSKTIIGLSLALRHLGR